MLFYSCSLKCCNKNSKILLVTFSTDTFIKSTFVAIDITENVGQLRQLQMASGMYHLTVKSVCEDTLVTVLSSWKVLALEIKYHSDSKLNGYGI